MCFLKEKGRYPHGLRPYLNFNNKVSHFVYVSMKNVIIFLLRRSIKCV